MNHAEDDAPAIVPRKTTRGQGKGRRGRLERFRAAQSGRAAIEKAKSTGEVVIKALKD